MMKRLSLLCVLLLMFGAAAAQARGGPPEDIFGVRPFMEREEVHERLEKIAQTDESEGEREEKDEVWTLKSDQRISYLLVGFDSQGRVRFVTAVARTGRMRYGDVASLKAAKQATDGRNYTYTWLVQSKGERPGYGVVARGGNASFLTSYTIYRLLK